MKWVQVKVSKPGIRFFGSCDHAGAPFGSSFCSAIATQLFSSSQPSCQLSPLVSRLVSDCFTA